MTEYQKISIGFVLLFCAIRFYYLFSIEKRIRELEK
jgi:hypothetical protein